MTQETKDPVPSLDEPNASAPATREDLERAKEAIIRVVADQNSSTRIVIADQNTETRAHIGSEVETLRADVKHTKNFMGRVLTAIKTLLTRFGIGSENL